MNRTYHAWAWGYNGLGQLGNGTNVTTNVAVQVVGLSDVKAMAGGLQDAFQGSGATNTLQGVAKTISGSGCAICREDVSCHVNLPFVLNTEHRTLDTGIVTNEETV